MNGYQMTADAYKATIAREKPTGEVLEDMRRKIAALEFLAGADEATIYELFNSAAFNDICRGYLLFALDRIGTDHDSRQKILYAMGTAFDTMTADEAESYYMNH